MPRLLVIIFLFFFNLLLPSNLSAYENDGVHISRSEPGSAQLESTIQNYVQQLVVNQVIKNVSSTFTRLVSNAKIQILPHIGQEAMYQMVQQVFIQEETKKFTSEIYEQAFNKAFEDFKKGVSQDIVQEELRDYIETEIPKITEQPVFRKMMEEIIEFGYVQSQKFMIMNIAQQQLRMKEIQMKYLAMQQMALAQYQKALQMNAIRSQQKQHAVQQHVQDAYIQEYQRQLYEQQMRYKQMEASK
jgi:hypothetical protein